MTLRRSAALASLAAHRCHDAIEQAAVDATVALLHGAGDPFARANLPGHITASAIVLDESAEHVLVVWHDGLQRWLQPGGHCEPGDGAPLDTARRETAEETGVHLAPERDAGRLVHVDVHDIPARGPEPQHRHHDLRFAFTASYEAAVPLGPGARSGWLRADALPNLGIDDSLRRAVACAVRVAMAAAGQHGASAPR
ncbi:MAG TPA: NUDIX domain-containing protein [Gemmatimonadaceae bacterium]|nr:NUDIX domain-containing protein [Gemmatimonadaceae bacterium]